MGEDGIDLSKNKTKSVFDIVKQGKLFEYVVTVCDEANEACPVFPNARQRLHWSLPDPSRATGTDDQRFAVFETVREAIRSHIERELLTLGRQAA